MVFQERHQLLNRAATLNEPARCSQLEATEANISPIPFFFAVRLSVSFRTAHLLFNLTRLRRSLFLTGRTQSQTEAEERAAVRRNEHVAVRRPAIRRVEVPTAATGHAVGACLSPEWIRNGGFTEGTIPIMCPRKQIAMQIECPPNRRTQFRGE